MSKQSNNTPNEKVVIATREYRFRGRAITAILYQPAKRQKNWSAGYKVVGVGEELSGEAMGVDGLQALLLAAQWVRLRLEALDIKFSWLGGEKGNTGIPRYINDGFGLAFIKRAQKLIADEEAQELVRRVAKTSKRKGSSARSK